MQAEKIEPIYLPEIAAKRQPGTYAELLRRAETNGQEIWQIWHLFAFRPEMTSHLALFTEEVMRAPSPLPGGLRELIAAYTSYLNECEFCWKCHAAVAAEMLGSQELVDSVLRDLESSALPEREKALLRYAEVITKDLPRADRSQVAALKEHGWSDEAIYYTIMACALFNFYNRWVTASGVHAVSDEGHRVHGKKLAHSGYDPEKRTKLV